MGKKKKSRKVGLIGTPKSPKGHSPLSNSKSKKGNNGNRAGSRQHLASDTPKNKENTKRNPKLGSKKAIDLSRYKSRPSLSEAFFGKTFFSPTQELEAIEAHALLNELLEREPNQLNSEELEFVDKMTARYQQLCSMLGIEDETLEEEEQARDPLSELDAIKINDYK